MSYEKDSTYGEIIDDIDRNVYRQKQRQRSSLSESNGCVKFIGKKTTGTYKDAYKYTAKTGMRVLRKSKWYWKPLMWSILPIAPIVWALTCRKFIRK
jgi:hypothetical protein